MEPLGRVIEEATPFRFVFKMSIEDPIALHDYVYVEVNNVENGKVGREKVLAEVIGLGSKNPLATERLVAEQQVAAYSYKLVLAEVVGYLKEGKIVRPKVAPDPNSPVYRAEDELLQAFFSGINSKIPLKVASLLNRPKISVPIHLQELQFHLGIFAATRAGKSYFAGKLIEEIMINTPFPIVVIDIHADYVMMDRRTDGTKHGDFNVIVYYPPGAPRVSGVTAEQRLLQFSPDQLTHEALITLLGATLGERQRIILRRILKKLRSEKKAFGLNDITAQIIEELNKKDENGKPLIKGNERARYESLLDRLEDLGEDISLPPTGMDISEFFRPKTLSVICLNGLRSKVQDAYASIMIEKLFIHQVSSKYDKNFMPIFLFIEEAHRIASGEGGGYAIRTISTAIRVEFGLFMVLISQRPRNIDPDILSNVGNYAVMRITNQQDQNIIENASESFSRRLIEDLPGLNQGEAVLVGPFVTLPVHVKTLDRRTMHHGVTPELNVLMNRINEALEQREKSRW
ncbi:MAG: ATP-binding protein [Nitrososphaerota archaeon]|nr:ATP-binding protein [Nitrososphaerota archaeon]